MKRELIIAFVQKELANERTGHDFYHGERVANLGLKLLLHDHPDASQLTQDIVFAAGLVHDTIDEKVCADPAGELEKVKKMLEDAELAAEGREEVVFTITHMSFSKNIGHHYQLPLAGQYVQDADRLESLGAIGIARAFTYGGKHGNLIYDPKIKPVKLTDHDQYRQHEETTINHFYEKLFHLAALMNTPAAKAEAEERTDYMKEFVARFMAEWQGK